MTEDSVINKFDIQLALTTSIMGSNIILTPFKKNFFLDKFLSLTHVIDLHKKMGTSHENCTDKIYLYRHSTNVGNHGLNFGKQL